MLIPAYVNPKAGSAQRALAALAQVPGFDIHQISPGDLPTFLEREVAERTPRVLVAGGDGTLARAASTLAGTAVALSVLPGGTLNHFARNHGIPLDLSEALALAVGGAVAATDVGYVNGQLFLNTSCVGAYTRYVRTRELIEPALGYWVGSVAAGARVLLSLHDIAVVLAHDGATRTYEAPFVFVGVQERGLAFPSLGRPVPQGASGLHIVVPRGRRQARRFAHALAHPDRHLPLRPPPAPGVDAAMVHQLTVRLPGRRAEVALDGELRELVAPLEYRFGPAVLRIVTCPASGSS